MGEREREIIFAYKYIRLLAAVMTYDSKKIENMQTCFMSAHRCLY